MEAVEEADGSVETEDVYYTAFVYTSDPFLFLLRYK